MEHTDTAFAALLDKVNAASPELWAALVRKTYVESTIGVIVGILLVVLALGGIVWGIRYMKREKYDNEPGVAANIVSAFVLMVGVVVILCSLHGMIEPTGTTLSNLLRQG